jgi:hypothetical protein
MPGHYYKVSRNWQASIEIAICAAVFGSLLCPALAADTVITPSVSSHFSPVDEAKIRAAGIRRLESRRLVLYTDLAEAPDVDELPQVFDQAFDLWCEYFKIDPAQYPDWKMRACLIDDPARFTAAALFPSGLPKFLNGYTRGYECWLNNQTSSYYRRHLLLHEGLHGIMFTLLGDHAPPWYIEGMAELLGTHRWQNGKLELPYFPKQADEVPKLGRIELVQRDFNQHHAKRLGDILAYDNQAHLKLESYGWSWAACAFFDGHPQYRDRFRQAISWLKGNDDFNTKLFQAFGGDTDQLEEQWQIFVRDLDYGYDFTRTAIKFSPGEPIGAQPAHISVQADHGWQNSGILLQRGNTYKLTATGQYQVANDPKPWISEPAGVSVRYIHSRPLGQLLAAVHPDRYTTHTVSAFLKPIVVGNETTITPTETGTLYFRINDSSGELSDNSGHADVTIIAN